jgi:type IV pilus assembly protein PilW
VRARQRGFNLTELTIALALGMTLLAAFLMVVQRCRDGFATAESLARLHDSARHALSVLVPDIEHAGFYGFTNDPAARLASALPAGADDCGTGFAIALGSPVQGSDNTYRLGPEARDCAPTASAGGARAGADTLTLRHASQSTVAAHAGRLQLYTQALVTAPLLLFADGRAPGPIDEGRLIRDLEVHTYYIANDSVGRRGFPALRVKTLTESAGAAQFRDEEILPGVEDLQVEFAVASRAADGSTRVHYVGPDSPRDRDSRVIAVRLWLRIRADAAEPGVGDDRQMSYANITFTPSASASEARQRRLLVERTVALRNARTP